MAAYETEQSLELEALESLFIHPGEFVKLSSNSFMLNLVPFPDSEELNYVGVTLSVEYPPEYPNTPPIWHLQNERNLKQSDIEEMEGIVNDIIEYSYGAALVYDIADKLQSWLREHNHPDMSMHEEMMHRLYNLDDEASAADVSQENDESSENEQYNAGSVTPLEAKQLCDASDRVTEEQFMKWAEKFRKEMEEAGLWKRYNYGKDASLSGKQMFEHDASLALMDEQPFAESVQGTHEL